MDPALRGRLNVLIGICTGIFGITLTQLLIGQPGGVNVLAFALIPTAIVVLIVILYLDNYAPDVSAS